MKEKDFNKKVKEIELLLKTNFGSDTEITYVMFLHTKSPNGEPMYQYYLHNAPGCVPDAIYEPGEFEIGNR